MRFANLQRLAPGWRTFLCGGSNLKSQTEKRKNVGYGCNNINEGLERKFCRILCNEQKKVFIPEIPSFLSSMLQYGKISFINYVINRPLAQLLSARSRCGRYGARFPDRSNRHSVANGSPPLRRSFGAV